MYSIVQLPLQNMADGDAGIAAHVHYDPYFPRLLSHVKRLLAQNIPILIRLHPGMSYPMDDDMLHYKVDREGHVVAVIGYDDEKQELILADPWDHKRWKGDRGGIVTKSYEEMMNRTVDCTLGFIMVPLPWNIKASMPNLLPENQPITLHAYVEYPCPEPLLKSENHVSNCHVKLELPTGLELVNPEEAIQPLGDGYFQPGDTKEVKWTVVRRGPVNGSIRIRARGIVTNTDPYPYSDIIGISGVAHITTINSNGEYTVTTPNFTAPVKM